MILRRVFGSGNLEAVSTDDIDAGVRVAGWYEHPLPRWLRLNLIASVDGTAAGADGTSETLTNRADRLILGVLRRQADVVLVGAASVRAEGYRLPKTAKLAILTASGNLTGHRVSSEGDPVPGRLLVLCPQSAVATATATLGEIAAEIIVIPDDAGRLNVASVVDFLHGRGLAKIICEGGPSLAAQLLSANVVDELCLSTSPRITGNALSLLGANSPTDRRLTLLQLLVDDASGIYARWSVDRSELGLSAS